MLTYKEIRAGFKKYFQGDEEIEKEVEEIISNIDSDKNKMIEYEEFLRATVNLDDLLTEENLLMAFNNFDDDGSGMLTHEEIKIALGMINDDPENYIIEKIIAELDINGDGLISFIEFKELMMKVLCNEQ
jgi:calcium-dependent protein kinase